MFKKKFDSIHILMIAMLVFLFTFAGVDRNLVFDGSDQALYDASRKEAISITFGYDSGYAYSGTVANSANTDVAITLASGYMLRTVTFYSDVEVTVTYTGSGIDAVNADNSFAEVIPAGKSVNWDFTNVTSINIANASGSTCNYKIYVRSARSITNAP